MTVFKYCKKMALQDEYKEIMKLNKKSFYFYSADEQKLANYFSKMYQQSAKEILDI
jgi:phosphoketolase